MTKLTQKILMAAGVSMLAACGGNDPAAATGEGAAAVTAPAAQNAATSSSPMDSNSTEASAQAAEAAVRAIYSIYLVSAETMATMDVAGPMERPIYSAELSQIIAAWRAANPGPEPTSFSDVDWICSCQDWNPGRSSLTIGSVSAREGGRYQVTARFNPGFDAPNSSIDFFMIEENGRWMVDDARFTAQEPMLREILIEETRAAR
jgi:hypothetical protein